MIFVNPRADLNVVNIFIVNTISQLTALTRTPRSASSSAAVLQKKSYPQSSSILSIAIAITIPIRTNLIIPCKHVQRSLAHVVSDDPRKCSKAGHAENVKAWSRFWAVYNNVKTWAVYNNHKSLQTLSSCHQLSDRGKLLTAEAKVKMRNLETWTMLPFDSRRAGMAAWMVGNGSLPSVSQQYYRGRFPRVFGDKFGEEFCDKFGDEFSESPNLVMN